MNKQKLNGTVFARPLKTEENIKMLYMLFQPCQITLRDNSVYSHILYSNLDGYVYCGCLCACVLFCEPA